MNLPPKGICIGCQWTRTSDGRTVEVRLHTGQLVTVELRGINSPGKNTQEGRDAKHFLETLLEENDDPLSLWLPSPQIPLGQVVPGVLFIGSQDVGEMLVRHGHATALKGYG